MQISQIRDEVSEGLLTFAWRQWAQVGVSATVQGSDRWALDPEALILFTIGIGRRDPRLFDEMLDWMALNYDLCPRRLRNLARRFPLPAGLVAAVIEWTRPRPHRTRPCSIRPAFLKQENQSSGTMSSDLSPSTIRYLASTGSFVPLAVRSGKSHQPNLDLMVNLPFRLRHLFGPGGRSEVMRVLLTWPEGSLDAARIADEAGFAKRNISDVLTSSAASGVIRSTWAGNERHFTAHQQRWSTLLGLTRQGMPAFVSWVHLLPAALQIMTWLDDKNGTAESDYIVASQARRLMKQLERDLETAGTDVPVLPPAHGIDYMSVFAETINAVLVRLRVAANRSAC